MSHKNPGESSEKTAYDGSTPSTAENADRAKPHAEPHTPPHESTRVRHGGRWQALDMLAAGRDMYRYCRIGHGYPNGRLYSLRCAVGFAWRMR